MGYKVVHTYKGKTRTIGRYKSKAKAYALASYKNFFYRGSYKVHKVKRSK